MVGIGRDNPVTVFTFTFWYESDIENEQVEHERTHGISKTNQFERISVESEWSTERLNENTDPYDRAQSSNKLDMST